MNEDDDEPKVLWGIWPWSSLVSKSSAISPAKRQELERAKRKAEHEEWEAKASPVTVSKMGKKRFKKRQVVTDGFEDYEVIKVMWLTKELEIRNLTTRIIMIAPQEEFTIKERK